ncbi:MAG: hypothetical protein HYV35_04305 [Lentisphaerae bacterium]|nr:hypothetical protein [Lentisphaerota bacterium]
MLALNEDSSHFFSWHPKEEMNAEGLDAWVDQYADTQVEELILCTNAQRSSMASTARQTVWDGFDPAADKNQPFFAGVPDQPLWSGGPNARELMYAWVYHAWLLHQQGLDPYARWIARRRRRGLRTWLSMRMNDVHYVNNPDHCIHDRFWKEHPEYRRTPPQVDGYNGQCFDYAIPEVFEYQLSYARELIARYDLDGFELDWMRNPYYFKPGREKEGLAVLTEFVAAVRQLLDQRTREVNHPIQLGVRVPSRPETALGLGFDVPTWAERRLVDKVAASSFLFLEFDLPVARWKALLKDTGVRLAGVVDAALQPPPGSACAMSRATTREMVRGAATAFWDRGVDQVYLFNHMDNNPLGLSGKKYEASDSGQSYRQMLREVGSLQTLSGLSRRHIITQPDTFAPEELKAPTLPRLCPAGASAVFNLATGPIPAAGQRVQLRLTTELAGGGTAPACQARLNGTLCPAIDSLPQLQGCSRPVSVFEAPSAAVRPGENQIAIHNSSAQGIQLTHVELAVSGMGGQWPEQGPETAASP